MFKMGSVVAFTHMKLNLKNPFVQNTYCTQTQNHLLTQDKKNLLKSLFYYMLWAFTCSDPNIFSTIWSSAKSHITASSPPSCDSNQTGRVAGNSCFLRHIWSQPMKSALFSQYFIKSQLATDTVTDRGYISHPSYTESTDSLAFLGSGHRWLCHHWDPKFWSLKDSKHIFFPGVPTGSDYWS